MGIMSSITALTAALVNWGRIMLIYALMNKLCYALGFDSLCLVSHSVMLLCFARPGLLLGSAKLVTLS